MSLNVRQHGSVSDATLIRIWSGLAEGSPRASLFTTPQWCECWAQTVGRRAQPVVLEFVDGGGDTVGIAPLCIDRTGGVRWLKFMGRDRACGDHLDVLSAPGYDRRCATALTEYLPVLNGGIDGVLLGELEPESHTRGSLLRWAAGQGLPVAEQEPRLVTYLDLPASFDAFLASLSKNKRHHVRRRRRGLLAFPAARIELIRSADRIGGLLDELFSLHEQRWEADGLYRDPAMRAFLERFCRVAAEHGWLRAYRLAIDDMVQAILIAFHWRGVACSYQIGRRPDCPIASPGVLLYAESIEQAIRERLPRYDFLRGDQEDKLAWHPQYVRQTTVVVGCRWPARAAMFAERSKDVAKAAMIRCVGERAWQRTRRAVKDSIGLFAGSRPRPDCQLP